MDIGSAINVMQAYKDGADIECRDIGEGGMGWRGTKNPSWDFSRRIYRIKPEPPKRKEYTEQPHTEGIGVTHWREVLPGDLTKEEVRTALEACRDRGWLNGHHVNKVFRFFLGEDQ